MEQHPHAFAACLAKLPAAERRAAVRQALEQVARLVHELHCRNLSQRDLKAANILVARGTGMIVPPAVDQAAVIPNHLPYPATAVWLIDLVGVRSFGKLARKRKVQNLARLNASFLQSVALTRSDRLRFLRMYLQWGIRGRDGWKIWWRAIAAATAAKARRNRRTGRPLA